MRKKSINITKNKKNKRKRKKKINLNDGRGGRKREIGTGGRRIRRDRIKKEKREIMRIKRDRQHQERGKRDLTGQGK